MRRRFVPLVLLLAACRDERPPAPTADQAEQLNEVEDLLNDQSRMESRSGTNLGEATDTTAIER